METVLSLLNEFGFERTVEPLSDPIVVHAVPGSGKTTLIKQALLRNHNIEAVTFGVPEKANIHGTYIKKARQGQRGRGNFSILDEYLSGEYSTGFNCLFSDPYQNHGDCLRAHFIGRCSHRFGNQTVSLLRDLGYNIASSKQDVVEKKNIFQLVNPEGVIICLEEGVENFLKWHNVEYKLPCQVRGATYDIVTFIHEKPLEELPPDYSKSLFPIAVGVAVAVVLFTLTRSTLPQVGDNIHNLPHGGNYQDGTKRISYCGPKDSFPSSSLISSGTPMVFGIIILLIFAIYVSEKWNQSGSRRCMCCLPGAPACTATAHN